MKWADAIKLSLGLGDRRLSLEEERHAVRVPCRIPVVVRAAALNLVHGHMVDVSASGLRLELPQNIGAHKKLDILLQSRRGPTTAGPGIQLVRELHVQGDLVWSHRERESNNYLVGVHARSVRGTGGEDMVAFLRNELALNVFEEEQRRRFRRFHVPWSVEILGVDGFSGRGAVKDISVCGLLFDSRHAFHVNQEMAVLVLADTASVRIHAQAVVKRCIMQSHQLGWETALAFLRLSEKDRHELAYALQRYLRKIPRGTTLS